MRLRPKRGKQQAADWQPGWASAARGAVARGCAAASLAWRAPSASSSATTPSLTSPCLTGGQHSPFHYHCVWAISNFCIFTNLYHVLWFLHNSCAHAALCLLCNIQSFAFVRQLRSCTPCLHIMLSRWELWTSGCVPCIFWSIFRCLWISPMVSIGSRGTLLSVLCARTGIQRRSHREGCQRAVRMRHRLRCGSRACWAAWQSCCWPAASPRSSWACLLSAYAWVCRSVSYYLNSVIRSVLWRDAILLYII